MLIPNDGINETVAHFIGYFQIRLEDARFRPEFEEFSLGRTPDPAEGEINPHKMDFQDRLDIRDVRESVAELRFVPPEPVAASLAAGYAVSPQKIAFAMPEIPEEGPHLKFPVAEPFRSSVAPQVASSDEPGSVILIASQIKYLFDDDVLVLGDYEFEPQIRYEAHAELEGMVDQALAVSASLTDLADLRSVPQLVKLVEDASAMVRELTPDDFGGEGNVFLETGERIDGQYGNGVKVDELPSLDEALAARIRQDQQDDEAGPAELQAPDLAFDIFEEPEAPAAQEPGPASVSIDASATPTTMNVSSGGNLVWNEAAIVTAGLAPSVVAVVGDYHRIDAIYQTNVLRDLDTIDGNWPAEYLSMGGNVVQNSATFTNHDFETKNGEPAKADGGFPAAWNVTSVEGDMIFLNWVSQYNFTSDNDTMVLTAMGTNTVISSGLNMGFNTLSFANLGQYFDLVVIGGSFYDGNFITQTNVLLDSDNLAVWGDSSAWKGSTATGENLLWNEASIENVGAETWTSGLPGHYLDAAGGNSAMPAGFRSDDALDGLGNLKVLHISGNVYDINYISQVNIVGDADDLAIYEASLTQALDSVWNVATGHNTLVNKASILDYDTVGQTAYVGGQIYSDAVLVQTEIIEGLTDRVTPRGNELANEVIAFLHDQTDIASYLQGHPAINPMDAEANHDVMQSVLA